MLIILLFILNVITIDILNDLLETSNKMKKELILEIIQERWSPYSFSPVPVEPFKLKAMFEAAGYAPSCNNEQPWIFVYTTRQENKVFADYIGFLNESNKVWAKEAYAIVISMARTRFSKDGKLNRYAFHDTGMAVANLLLQALAMDVYVHQMGGFSVDMVKEYFGTDENIEPVAVMAVGYLGDGYSLPPLLLKRDENRRPRKPVNEYSFKNSLSNRPF
jgi:nitroreductase